MSEEMYNDMVLYYFSKPEYENVFIFICPVFKKWEKKNTPKFDQPFRFSESVISAFLDA